MQEYVIETHEAYPHKMVFSVFGADRIARFNVQVGQEVMVSFDIDAHEYQGRWFNSIRAYDVRLVDPAQIWCACRRATSYASCTSRFPATTGCKCCACRFPTSARCSRRRQFRRPAVLTNALHEIAKHALTQLQTTWGRSFF